MFLGSESKVYILDKVEGNPTQLNGHPAFASEWCVTLFVWCLCQYILVNFLIVVVRDLDTNQARPMDIITDAFCASGMHFPNGSYVTFGGNGAVGPGGTIGSVVGPTGTGAHGWLAVA